MWQGSYLSVYSSKVKMVEETIVFVYSKLFLRATRGLCIVCLLALCLTCRIQVVCLISHTWAVEDINLSTLQRLLLCKKLLFGFVCCTWFLINMPFDIFNLLSSPIYVPDFEPDFVTLLKSLCNLHNFFGTFLHHNIV